MKKKFFIIILSIVCALICAIGLSACSVEKTTDDGRETCAVRFDAGRGTIFGRKVFEIEVDINSILHVPSENPVCEGYIFLGWNLTGDKDSDFWDTEKITHDTTLYAVWARAYTVTFDADGGEFSESGKAYYKVTVADGAKISAPDIEPPDNIHSLKGWLNNYSYWDFTTDTVSRDIILVADWTYSDEVETALAPFTYSNRYGRLTITGVKDKETVTSLVVPSIVSYIDENAFKDCVNLETIVIDDNVLNIGDSAFSGCENLKYVTLPAGLREIEDYTFEGCTALETIDVPNTLVRLGVGAFYNCLSLTAIELPLGVKSIQGSTFRGCSSLEEIKFGANITELGAYAFFGCASLKEFEIPSGVTELSGCLFEGCLSLQSITVPATCVQILQYAFKNSGLVTAAIHSQEVNLGAFTDCVSLTNLTIGAEVEELGQGVFSGCKSLTEVKIPDTVTAIAGLVFENCSSLKTVSIGDGLTEISGGMFSGCSALRNVEFGSNVSIIKSTAFKDCISLLNFTVPSTVTTVDRSAFSGCARLVEMYNLTDNASLLDSAKPLTTNTVIHNSASDASIIKTINGFSFCMYRTKYETSESIYLLDYNGDAQSITLPADYEGDSYKVFDYALSCNSALESVTFSTGIIDIGSEILFGSENVTSLAVASGNAKFKSDKNCVIDVANKKFVLGCKTSVIPTDGSVTAIGSNVFCHNNTIINDAFKIPEIVTAIDSCAFDGVEGIARIEGYVQYVDKWAVRLVYDGYDYIDLEIAAGTLGIAGGAFNPNISGNNRGILIKSVRTNAELKYIGEESFANCNCITEVTLNNGLVSIGDRAFYGCSKLEEIIIPDTVTSLGNVTFGYCSALKYVKLSSEITELKYRTFSGCKALESLVLQSKMNKFGDLVFQYCNANLVVYYTGDAAMWNAITQPVTGDAESRYVTKIYYSETEPSSGIAWHYGADGKPTTQY